MKKYQDFDFQECLNQHFVPSCTDSPILVEIDGTEKLETLYQAIQQSFAVVHYKSKVHSDNFSGLVYNTQVLDNLVG